MAIVHFYEKPGCFNNKRQKQLLLDAGHILFVHNLLEQPWAQERKKLRSFFGSLQVADWFNRSAPAIKNGDIVPEALDEEEALDLMTNDPLLIRRPLLEVDGRRRAGFDAEVMEAWLGVERRGNLERCTQSSHFHSCKS